MVECNRRIGDAMKSKKKKTQEAENSKNIITGYIKVILIFVVTIFIVLLLRNWYLNRVNYQLSIPIIKETLTQEINSNEIYNYIRENENSVIYVGVVTNQDCRDFEEIFNEVIKDKHLENTITYLNLTDENHIQTFLKEFNKFYDANLTGYPSIIVFEDGEVKDILISDNDKALTKEDATKFLEKNNVVSVDY